MELIKVKKFIKECKMTEEEKQRNCIGQLFVIGY